MVQCFLSFAQEKKVIIDTLLIQKDTVITDTLLMKRGVSKDAIEIPITHVAQGYRKTDLVNKKVYLVGSAVVTYGDITLKADSIVLNMGNGCGFCHRKKRLDRKSYWLSLF
jgi:lipopolysaccharide assembly outer membrane protein LptD (OstA)